MTDFFGIWGINIPTLFSKYIGYDAKLSLEDGNFIQWNRIWIS